MIGRLVIRHLALHPVRSLVFVGAYAAGVAVMLSLLSIGEVMVEQSRDEQWVGGGDVIVIPAGIDLETLRTGGAAFFGIQQSRFIARSILRGPRLAAQIEAVAPWIDDRAIYLRRSGSDTVVAVRASAEIPSAAQALEAPPELVAGLWQDSEADRRWLEPTRFELYQEIDRFHLPPEASRSDSTWAEWHYFNLLWPGEGRWLYLSYILGGDVLGGHWGGIVLVRYRTPGGSYRSFADTLSAAQIEFSTASADVSFGPQSVRLADDPVRYLVRAELPGLEGGPPLSIELAIEPDSNRYFPPAQLAASDSFVSGYVVPALRGSAAGRVCVGQRCEDVRSAIAYHDHNWGTWGGVIWDWGIAHVGDFDVLYGGVHGSAAERARARGARFLAYLVDADGVAAILEPRELIYSGERLQQFEGVTVRVPELLRWTATKAADSLTAEITLEEISLSSLTLGSDADVYFAQMAGTLRLSGVVGGRPVDQSGPGFFETYLRQSANE